MLPVTLRATRALALLLLPAALGACVNRYAVNRGLHYIEDEQGEQTLVRSDPPAPAAYEAYLRARLALERDPPALDEARSQVFNALRWEQQDPLLWTLLAEIEWHAGNTLEAEAALEQALSLQPDFVNALALQAKLAESP